MVFQKWHFRVAILFIVVTAFVMPKLFAQNASNDVLRLFREADPTGIRSLTHLDSTVLQMRHVTIDLSLLPRPGTAAMSPKRRTILFNLFDHTAFNVVLDRSELSQNGLSIIWYGHIQGMMPSDVTLVISGKVMNADIRGPGAAFYQVRYVGEGVHVICSIDQASFPSEREPLTVDDLPETSLQSFIFSPPGETPENDDELLLDMMVVYTPAARQYAGGTVAMQSLIEMAVAETNAGYANSGVLQRLRLVHTEEVDYTETPTSPFDNALMALRNPADGLIDEVHVLRDTYGADMVNLVINRNTHCGLAYQMGAPSAAFEAYAFSVVSRLCLTGTYTLAHELGHNQGAAHDRDHGREGTFPYSFGYQAPDRAFRTIMANECPGFCPPVNYWSNPDVFYQDQPTGIAHTEPDAADNRLTLNQTRQIAANWRPSVVPSDPPVFVLGLSQGGQGQMEVVSVDPDHHANITWLQLPWPAYNAAAGGTHPSLCNLDNDPENEVVVGLDSYPANGGFVEIRDDRQANYAHLDWIRVPWPNYNDANGATYPACGDFDGDGRDELAIGLGTYPAAGGWMEIRDDSMNGYAHMRWLRVPWADYNDANGVTYPACGDLDGDGRDELAIGLGTYTAAGGWLEIRNDAMADFAHMDWTRISWSDYNAANGANYPSAVDVDGDGRDELAIGLATYPAAGGWFEVKDDLLSNLKHLSWGRVHWSNYNNANGETRLGSEP